MDRELVDPFITATKHVLQTLCQIEVQAGEPRLKEGTGTWGEVSALIGMASPDFTGNLVLSFDKPAILAAVSKMLMEDFKEVTNEITDAVGEMTNMICGGAKKEFSERGQIFNMATPLMITGRGVGITQVPRTVIVQIPFEIDAGHFVVESSLARRKVR